MKTISVEVKITDDEDSSYSVSAIIEKKGTTMRSKDGASHLIHREDLRFLGEIATVVANRAHADRGRK